MKNPSTRRPTLTVTLEIPAAALLALLLVAHAALAASPFLLAFGGFGTGPGQFNRPHTLAVDQAGNVYVVDTNNERIEKFDNDGGYLGELPVGGAGIAVDSRGRIILARTDTRTVEVRDAGGAVLFSCSVTPDSLGPGFAYDVAVDAADRIYVTNIHSHLVEIFASDGAPIATWGVPGSGPGEFMYPAGIAVSRDGTVYVADQGNHRIQAYTGAGAYLTGWGGRGTAPGQFDTPNFIAVDVIGDVYVADENNSRIQRFSSTGEFRSSWGSLGSGPGRFRFPNDVAVDREGNVFVADTDNHRVQKFGLDPTPARRETFGSFKLRYRETGARDDRREPVAPRTSAR